MADAPGIDRSWVAAWDQVSSQQDRLSRELMLTWIVVGLILLAAAVFGAGVALKAGA